MFKYADLYIKLRKYLPYIFVLYAIPLVFIAATLTPPFQVPDEPNHFARAEQVTRLVFVPVFIYDRDTTSKDSVPGIPRIFYPDKGGFAADKGIFDVWHYYEPISHHANVKVKPAMLDSSKSIKWNKGAANVNFVNTGIYPPIVYIMPAMGIAIGKMLDMTVIRTLYLSRLLNGLLSIMLCFLALLLGKRSGPLMFIVLLFPMTISLFGSVSQDAVLISCTFLLTGIIDNAEFGEVKNYDKWHLCCIVILMCIIGISKPPYLVLLFAFLFLHIDKKIKFAAIIIPFVIVASWLFINHANFNLKFADPELRINAKLQFLQVVHHPLRFIGLFFKFDRHGLFNASVMFVGVLGWLDTWFKPDYYKVTYTILFLGIVHAVKYGKQDNSRLRLALFLAAFLTLLAVLSAQYITWTSLGNNELCGMQGRYLLPIFAFPALAVSSMPVDKMQRLKTVLLLLVLLFPIYTCVNLVNVLLNRYY